MEHTTTRSQFCGMGSLAVPLVYLEVTPLIRSSSSNSEDEAILLAAVVKLQLLRQTFQMTLLNQDEAIRIQQWSKQKQQQQQESSSKFRSGYLYMGTNTNKRNDDEDDKSKAVLYLNQNNPLLPQTWPCRCQAFAFHRHVVSTTASDRVIVTDATLVRVCCSSSCWNEQLTGEAPEPALSKCLEMELWNNQNPETIQELSLQIRLLLTEPIQVGTTADALQLQQAQQHKSRCMQAAIRRYAKNTSEPSNDLDSTSSRQQQQQQQYSSMLLRRGALIVHSPDHGAGKTLLVQAIAQKVFDCRIHVIRPGPLLAQYGIQADAALETIVHQIAVQAALQETPVCIVLDQLDAMLPGKMTNDAATPVLNGIASYLKQLTTSLQRERRIPFPTKNPLYNLHGRHGCVLSVQLCLVAIVTCPDDKRQNNDSEGNTIFNVLDANLYRLPALAAQTRLSAFRFALEQSEVKLAPDLEQQLPYLAASAVWARGSVFRRVAQRVCSLTKGAATVSDFVSVLAEIGKSSSVGTNVKFLASNDSETGGLFATVGGNKEAKIALEESLALDPNRRRLLYSFGISPPTGVLLYGPPGTGKTLLAKAVARLLRSTNPQSSSIGGAFISLNISDIVLAEIGSGEKRVVSVFETARMNSPSVVFIDEFQALFMERSSSGSGRLSTTLLQCMDDVKKWGNVDLQASGEEEESESIQQQSRVVVLAATNTPWMVDRAFLRPGRFDRVVHIGLPNLDERNSILQLQVGRMKTRVQGNSAEMEQLCDKIAVATEGFSGADLAALCRAAAVRCLMESEDYIDERHFFEVLNRGMAPSSDSKLVQRIKQWHP